MSDWRRLREGKKKRVADEGGKRWRKKDTGGLGLKKTEKDEGFGKNKDIKTGINVKNEQLRKRGKERDGEKTQRLPQDCANPSNPDTS